ncbi:hypothetical protein C8J57DRAFT_1501455 [Mycena rebaudengoi]|nr:hypothetical protein C8J57DRAFT_1501455 [Mycena rebaudengoi]
MSLPPRSLAPSLPILFLPAQAVESKTPPREIRISEFELLIHSSRPAASSSFTCRLACTHDSDVHYAFGGVPVVHGIDLGNAP